jgi:hypothetical protein
MGKALDKAFDFEGIVNSISSALNSAQNYFNSLSPEIQKTIFAVGGLVAVVGPLLFAIGGIISIAGPAIAAITSISLPMVAVGAIVVSFASTVIRNWGMIEAVLKDTGVWMVLAETVKFAVGVIGEAFMLLFEALTGDWSSFGERLKNIVKRIYNTIVDFTWTFVRESLNILQSFFSLFGGSNMMTRGIEIVKNSLGSFVSKISADVPKATNYLNKLGNALAELGVSGAGESTGSGVKIDSSDALKKLEKQRAILGNLNLKQISSPEVKNIDKIINPEQYTKNMTWVDEMLAAANRLKKGLPQILSQINLSQAGLTIEEQIKSNVTERAKIALDQLNSTVKEMLEKLQIELVVNTAANLGEAVGKALGGSFDGLGNVFSNILQTIGGFMVQLGTSMLTADRLIKISKDLFGTELGTGAIIALIAGGGVLKGLGNTLFKDTPKFAQGGMVTGPTFAMMGDNASGREMALPWEKTGVFAQAIAANMGGGSFGGGGGYEIKIRAEDLVIILDRYNRKVGK